MLPLLAELAQVSPAADAASWGVVTAMGSLAAVAVSLVTLFKFASGKGGERQIEPTQIAAIRAELSMQTATLGKLDRELGALSAKTTSVAEKVAEVSAEQKRQEESTFRRINAISQESTATRTRVDGLERRENQR